MYRLNQDGFSVVGGKIKRDFTCAKRVKRDEREGMCKIVGFPPVHVSFGLKKKKRFIWVFFLFSGVLKRIWC